MVGRRDFGLINGAEMHQTVIVLKIIIIILLLLLAMMRANIND